MKPGDVCSASRSAIDAYQMRALQHLLTAVLQSNPFYLAKLRTAGSVFSSREQFVRQLPYTLKSEVVEDQVRHPPHGTNLTYPHEKYTRFHQTSGSTGKPLRWLDTNESWERLLECWVRVYQSAGVGPEDRVFFAFSFGPFLGFWTAFGAATRLECLTIPGGGMRSAARLQAILDNGVTVLCCTPTYAIRLAEVAAEEGLDLSSSQVRRILVAGEPGGSIPATRALIERLWPGARVVDHHGMTEVGPVSYECPQRRGVLHIIESAYLPEVIDPANLQAVAPGETGELVLTTLVRTGSPLIRYRTGDTVRLAESTQCACGSCEMALEGGILGRTDDMVVVRGVNLFPSAVEEVLRSAQGVGEFRVETYTERALTEMRLHIEPADGCDPANLEERVQLALDTAFGLRVSVNCVPAGSLPRFEAKAQRWVRR